MATQAEYAIVAAAMKLPLVIIPIQTSLMQQQTPTKTTSVKFSSKRTTKTS